MMRRNSLIVVAFVLSLGCAVVSGSSPTMLRLGSEQLVQADGVDIEVPGYSVPSLADLNNDGLEDLIVGEGGGTVIGKVRIYLNTGSEGAPAFGSFDYAQSSGVDLTCTQNGCMGCFPRAVYWNSDGLKDLMVGNSLGTIEVFLNTGTEQSPTFDGGTLVKIGSETLGTDLDVGKRATPSLVDWNNDDRIDIVSGGLDGFIRVYESCGCLGVRPPSFLDLDPAEDVGGSLVMEGASALYVPGVRSSPVIMDLDGDGKKDILTGNTSGQLLFYSNVGTDAAPAFDGYVYVESDGVPIDLAGSGRSRPFVCDWTGDGYPDILIGYQEGVIEATGKIHLYQSVGVAGDVDKDYDVDLDDVGSMGYFWLGEDDDSAWADIDGSGTVDFFDFALLCLIWGA